MPDARRETGRAKTVGDAGDAATAMILVGLADCQAVNFRPTAATAFVPHN